LVLWDHGALLRSVLPPSLVARLDFGTLKALPGTFIDAQMAGAESDLLFSVELSGRPVLVYVLVEHKSASDRWVTFQVLRYVVRIWERILATRATAVGAATGHPPGGAPWGEGLVGANAIDGAHRPGRVRGARSSGG